PDSAKLAISTSLEKSSPLEIWDINEERAISHWSRERPPQLQKLIDNSVQLLTWSPDGALLAVVGLGDSGENGNPFYSSHVHVIDVANGQRILKRPFGNRPRYGGKITALAWSPDSHFLALGSSEGLLDVVELDTGKGVMSCSAHDVPIAGLVWSRDG